MAFLNKLSSIPKKIKVSSFYRFLLRDVIYGPLTNVIGANVYTFKHLQMNADGSKIIISFNPSDSGSNVIVRVYSKINNQWTQEGSDITGPYTLGESLAINSSGNRIAISDRNLGHVKIYELSNSQWVQLGSTIAPTPGGGWGEALAMNAAGDRIVIGCFRNVRAAVYSWNGTVWSQLGNGYFNLSADFFGYAVAIDSIGNTIAITAPYENYVPPFPQSSKQRAGSTRIYSWNGSQWTQKGQTIYGKGIKDYLGYSVSINAAGDRVILGAHGNFSFFYPDTPSNGTYGYAQAYSWDAGSSTWVQLGNDIFGQQKLDDGFGYSTSMNSIGDTVVISSEVYRLIFIYYYNGTDWIKKSPTMYTGMSGKPRANISKNGNKIAFGADSYNNQPYSQRSYTQIYEDNFA